jgi:hypothetical protein
VWGKAATATPTGGCQRLPSRNDVRQGPASVHHESVNGWPTTRTAKRLAELAEWADHASRQQPPGSPPIGRNQVVIKVDDDGVGGGVVDLLRSWGFFVVPVNAGSVPSRPDDYPNKRSELWFQTRERARSGKLDLSRLPREVLQKLQVQAMTPLWKLDANGRRVVEPKAETKKKLGRSPDGMDSLNLAFYEAAWELPPVIDVPRVPLTPEARREHSAERPARKDPGQGPTITRHFGGHPNIILQDSDFPERPRRRPFHDR